MRARDAENLIAEILTKESKGTDLASCISESELLGLRRAKPIYARKIKEKENLKKQRRYMSYYRILSLLAYPFVVLIRIFKVDK